MPVVMPNGIWNVCWYTNRGFRGRISPNRIAKERRAISFAYPAGLRKGSWGRRKEYHCVYIFKISY